MWKQTFPLGWVGWLFYLCIYLLGGQVRNVKIRISYSIVQTDFPLPRPLWSRHQSPSPKGWGVCVWGFAPHVWESCGCDLSLLDSSYGRMCPLKWVLASLDFSMCVLAPVNALPEIKKKKKRLFSGIVLFMIVVDETTCICQRYSKYLRWLDLWVVLIFLCLN